MKKVLARFAKRFIAGETMADAVEVVRRLNEKGIKATIDVLGENTRVRKDADNAVAEYLSLLKEIKSTGIDATISIKLTHMGLDITDSCAEEHLRKIVKQAAEQKSFVRIDMEGSAYLERTLEIFHRVHEEFGEVVGVAIQSYLYRSEVDVKRLIDRKASVRLVKGAYGEPDSVAFPEKRDVDANFSTLMRMLMTEGHHRNRPAIATHDDVLINEAKRIARNACVENKDVEFQLLLGIREKLQDGLAKDGYKVRVYVPYGPEWLPYIMRRLTERKENLYFVLKNYFK